MQEQNKSKKNHWTPNKVDNANKKISKEIYQRNRQASIHIKIDDLAIFINDKITRRGIAKGLVSIQEDLNKNLLEVEKYTIKALMLEDKKEQIDCLLKAKEVMKIETWTDIRFLMVNRAITPGEISELIRRQLEIDKEIEKWLLSIEKAISAKW